MLDDANPRAVPGDNNPPADPFGAHTVHIDDLYIEAGNWADGADIENEDQAAVVDRLIDDFKAAIEACEVSRDTEKKPFADKVKEIHERYYPLIGDTKQITGKAIRAKQALLAVKTRWGNKVAAIQREKAEALRREAEAQAKLAAETARAAVGNLEATEQAEDLIREAQGALKAAAMAEKPTVRGMRDNWVIKGFQDVEDLVSGKLTAGSVIMLRHYFQTRQADLIEACLELARAEVRAGKRTIPGLLIENERRAV